MVGLFLYICILVYILRTFINIQPRNDHHQAVFSLNKILVYGGIISICFALVFAGEVHEGIVRRS